MNTLTNPRLVSSRFILRPKSRKQYVHFLVSFALLVSVCALTPTGKTSATDDLERSVALMAKIGASGSPSFSPDGTRLAFVSNLNGIPQVWTMPATGGFPTLVTAFDHPVGFVTWSPNG